MKLLIVATMFGIVATLVSSAVIPVAFISDIVFAAGPQWSPSPSATNAIESPLTTTASSATTIVRRCRIAASAFSSTATSSLSPVISSKGTVSASTSTLSASTTSSASPSSAPSTSSASTVSSTTSPGPSTSTAPPYTACTITIGNETATGSMTTSGCRYTLKYGVAARWADSVSAPSLGPNTTALPPVCPQFANAGIPEGHAQSEDCLYAVVYTPANATGAPILVWIHGGSFSIGGAVASGLDGSPLASLGNVVIVLQYRLGALGFLPPVTSPSAADPNLGVKDVVLGLRAVEGWAAALGGDKARVTVGGHSSGASLIRALWATPGVEGLFHRIISQSDPIDIGMASTDVTSQLQDFLYTGKTAEECEALSVEEIVTLGAWLSYAAGTGYLDIAGVPFVEPFRPTFGVPSLPHEPTLALWNAPGNLMIDPMDVPLLITTVAYEGGSVAASLPVPSFHAFLDGNRAALVTEHYQDGTPQEALAEGLTDGVFRCPARAAAQFWGCDGGSVYVAEFHQGATYPGNAWNPLCAGRVCHEDDILVTFGSADTSITAEVMSLWSNFIATGVPHSEWAPFLCSSGSSGQGVRVLGGAGTAPACPDGFWGDKVKWDFQVYTS